MDKLEKLLSKGSPDLKAAVQDETFALMGCAQYLGQAYTALTAKLGRTGY